MRLARITRPPYRIRMVITIDGYAASGKSSAAIGLANALQFRLLNTGWMYRAAGLALQERGFDLGAETRDRDGIRALFAGFQFDMPQDQVILGGVDYTERITCEGAGALASLVGTFGEVREKLKAEQRRLAVGEDIICEGRDQGTAVFPEARVKFFFWASPEVRAARRMNQLVHPDYATVLKQIRDRDAQDENRPLDPLMAAPDAIRFDTSELSEAEVLRQMLAVVAERRG